MLTTKVASILCLLMNFCIQYGHSYCTPLNLSCWPSTEDINNFKKTITGELLLPTDKDYNKSDPKNPYIDIKPYFVLFPANKADIINSFPFIRTHDLELSIFSTGHSTSGRSSGIYNNSFQINFSNNKNIELIEYENNKYAIKAQTGANFGTLYKYVNNINFSNTSTPQDAYLIAGGNCATVALAGYIMGGGEPVLLRYLGLGVDSILEFELIIANGTVIIANNKQNTDLFWALRGGGGGSFGVVWSITIKLHQYKNGKSAENGITSISATYPFYNNNNELIGDQVLTHALTECIALNMSTNMNGVIDIIVNPKESAFISFNLLYMGNINSALNDNGIKCLVDYKATWQIDNGTEYEYYSTFQDYHENIPEDNSYNQYGFDTILSQSNITNNNYIGQIVGFINELLYNVDFTATEIDGLIDIALTILGGQAANNVDASLSAAWRSRYGIDSYFMALWKNKEYNDKITTFMDGYSNTFLSIGYGAYFNDDIDNNINWKQQYWGMDNYNKLLSIKNKYDPKPYLLSCVHCIGYESDTDETNNSLSIWIIVVTSIVGLVVIGTISLLIYNKRKTENNVSYGFALLSDKESNAVN